MKPPVMKIIEDDLTGPEIYALLNEHMASMHALSPPESVHALDLSRLRQPEIRVWSAWEDATLLGCGALKELDANQGEVKSMRTPNTQRRRGAGRALLLHIIDVARSRGYKKLYLETGAVDEFKPAHYLYQSVGFTFCEAFGDYTTDPHSVFMVLSL